jgi:hypothetical protein
MSKIGIIWVGFNCEDTLDRSLSPWIRARQSQLDGHDFIVCAVSVPFEGFGDKATDKTRTLLGFSLTRNEIDHAIVQDKPMKETEARGAALRWLVEKGCTLSIMVDADEFWTIDQISKALSFMESRPHLAWARVCLKNYVFDAKTYLVEPFTPPRIHRLSYQGVYRAVGFEQDNDVKYALLPGGALIGQDGLAHATVPKNLVWVPHESWPNSDRSRRKIEYQLKGRGWPSCSFSWDDSQGGLIWNPSLPIPETDSD